MADADRRALLKRTRPKRKVSVMLIQPMGDPVIVAIEATLEAQQALVGGLIQPLDVPGLPGLSIVVNEEGLLLGLQPNRTVPPWGPLCGPIYVARWDEEGEIRDLRPADVDAVMRYLDANV